MFSEPSESQPFQRGGEELTPCSLAPVCTLICALKARKVIDEVRGSPIMFDRRNLHLLRIGSSHDFLTTGCDKALVAKLGIGNLAGVRLSLIHI